MNDILIKESAESIKDKISAKRTVLRIVISFIAIASICMIIFFVYEIRVSHNERNGYYVDEIIDHETGESRIIDYRDYMEEYG